MEITENNSRTPDKNEKSGIRSVNEKQDLIDLETGLGFIVSILD